MKAVLVYRTAALGDYIIATPAIAEVRRRFPGYRIVLLTMQPYQKSKRIQMASYISTAKRAPWVELTIPHLVDEYFMLEDTRLSSILAARRQLAGFDFHAGIIMIDPGSEWRGRLKKWLMMRLLVGLSPVLGWRGPGWFSKNRAPLHKAGNLPHHVLGPFQFLKEMSPPGDFDVGRIAFDLRPGDNAEQWAAEWLATHATGRLVALAPGSIQPHKKWPPEKFAALMRDLLSRHADLTIAILGTPADKPLGDELAAISPARVLNLAGATSIAQSAALLRKAELLIGNDGGAMHLGDAMGCRVISLVPGIEYPDSIEPWNNKALAIRHPVPCAPCYNMTFCPLGHNACMVDLPLAHVLANCARVLDAPAGR